MLGKAQCQKSPQLWLSTYDVDVQVFLSLQEKLQTVVSLSGLIDRGNPEPAGTSTYKMTKLDFIYGFPDPCKTHNNPIETTGV